MNCKGFQTWTCITRIGHVNT